MTSLPQNLAQFHNKSDELFEKFDLTLSTTMNTQKSKWVSRTVIVGVGLAVIATSHAIQHYGGQSFHPKEILEQLAAEPLYQTIATSALSFLQISVPYAAFRRIGPTLFSQSDRKVRGAINLALNEDEKAELAQMVAMNPHLQKVVVQNLVQDGNKNFGSQDLAKFKSFHQQYEQLQEALYQQLPENPHQDNKEQEQLRQWFQQQIEKVKHIRIDRVLEQLQEEAQSIKDRQQLQADTLNPSFVQRPARRL